MKVCSKCKIPKDDKDFYVRSTGYVRPECKECTKKKNKEQPYNKDKQREYRIRWETKTGKARSKKRYKMNKDEIRQRTLIQYWSLSGQIRSYVKSAKKRNLQFLITREECAEFFNKQCSYCGDTYKGLGIDRVDNNIGYILNNCVPCCSNCNFMKRSLTLEYFTGQIYKIYNKLKLWENTQKSKEI